MLLVCVNVHWMFILNKHSTSLSNTSCILRPCEDREKHADESDFERRQRGINLLICSTLCQYTSRQTSKSVLPCSASLGSRKLQCLSNYFDTVNKCILAVTSAKISGRSEPAQKQHMKEGTEINCCLLESLSTTTACTLSRALIINNLPHKSL